jgi:diguanylate cyclase (GGDEF)-like protein/PAS domain S-box-containing protein
MTDSQRRSGANAIASRETPIAAKTPPTKRRRASASVQEMRAELETLANIHARMQEAEETLRAIRNGEVDALFVNDDDDPEAAIGQVFTLSSADRPYRIFVENMQEGAATLSAARVILFANSRLGELLGCPASSLVSQRLTDFISESSAPDLLAAIGADALGTTLELSLARPDGGEVAVLVGVSPLDVEGERLTCLTFTDLTAEHRLLSEVRASQQRFEALYKGAPVPAYTWQDGPTGLVLIDYNDAADAMTGGALAGSLGTTASSYYESDLDLLVDLAHCLTEQAVMERATSSPDRDLHITMVPVPPDLVVVHAQDITERSVAERALRESEERYRSIVENSQEGISIVDARGDFAFANLRTADLLGRDVESLTGMRAESLVGSRRGQIAGGDGISGSISSARASESTQYEISVIRPDNTSIELLISTAPIVLSGSGEAGTLCMMTDVSGLRQAEEELAHWALHDALTGLPNRILLVDRIDQAFGRASRRPNTVAALFCDLDGFKEINDSFGHHIGDQVLSLVAARLREAVRPADTVARIGGDEFVILCEGMNDESVAFGIAARVLSSIAEEFDLAGHTMALSVSVGVAFARNDNSAELLGNADAAMYLAKQRGRNRAELFDEQLRKVASERISLIADLRHAVARDELRVHYQPIFTLDGEELLGVEALVRWQHPERGLLFPDAFIPAAESANLIGEIGAWVLKAACRQAARWGHSGADGLPLHMAVNVSARQLAQGSGLVELVADELNDSGIDPSSLVLEVTESVVMDNAEATLSLLNQLKKLGVRLAIDDFGTGYSSLIYLKRFPVDMLKVDRAFVSGLGSDSDDSAIVASVVSLARSVGIVAIAEGVETAEQLAALQDLGCGCGQGYLWSRPLPAEELEQMMQLGAFRIPTQRTRMAVTKRGDSGKSNRSRSHGDLR